MKQIALKTALIGLFTALLPLKAMQTETKRVAAHMTEQSNSQEKPLIPAGTTMPFIPDSILGIIGHYTVHFNAEKWGSPWDHVEDKAIIAHLKKEAIPSKVCAYFFPLSQGRTAITDTKGNLIIIATEEIQKSISQGTCDSLVRDCDAYNKKNTIRLVKELKNGNIITGAFFEGVGAHFKLWDFSRGYSKEACLQDTFFEKVINGNLGCMELTNGNIVINVDKDFHIYDSTMTTCLKIIESGAGEIMTMLEALPQQIVASGTEKVIHLDLTDLEKPCATTLYDQEQYIVWALLKLKQDNLIAIGCSGKKNGIILYDIAAKKAVKHIKQIYGMFMPLMQNIGDHSMMIHVLNHGDHSHDLFILNVQNEEFAKIAHFKDNSRFTLCQDNAIYITTKSQELWRYHFDEFYKKAEDAIFPLIKEMLQPTVPTAGSLPANS